MFACSRQSATNWWDPEGQFYPCTRSDLHLSGTIVVEESNSERIIVAERAEQSNLLKRLSNARSVCNLFALKILSYTYTVCEPKPLEYVWLNKFWLCWDEDNRTWVVEGTPCTWKSLAYPHLKVLGWLRKNVGCSWFKMNEIDYCSPDKWQRMSRWTHSV